MKLLHAPCCLVLCIVLFPVGVGGHAFGQDQGEKAKPNKDRVEQLNRLLREYARLQEELAAMAKNSPSDDGKIAELKAKTEQVAQVIRLANKVKTDKVYEDIHRSAQDLMDAVQQLGPRTPDESGFDEALEILQRTLRKQVAQQGVRRAFDQAMSLDQAEAALKEAQKAVDEDNYKSALTNYEALLSRRAEEFEKMKEQVARYKADAERQKAQQAAIAAEAARQYQLAKEAQQAAQVDAADAAEEARAAVQAAEQQRRAESAQQVAEVARNAAQEASSDVAKRLHRLEDELTQIKELLKQLLKDDK